MININQEFETLRIHILVQRKIHFIILKILSKIILIKSRFSSPSPKKKKNACSIVDPPSWKRTHDSDGGNLR